MNEWNWGDSIVLRFGKNTAKKFVVQKKIMGETKIPLQQTSYKGILNF